MQAEIAGGKKGLNFASLSIGVVPVKSIILPTSKTNQI